MGSSDCWVLLLVYGIAINLQQNRLRRELMGGRASKNKGYRIEKKIEAMLKDIGLPAKRMPLSGAAPGYKGDIQINDLLCEVKSRKGGAGFTTIERWLGENDYLFLHRNHAQPLVVMNFDHFATLVKGGVSTETHKSGEGSTQERREGDGCEG
jgi:Holliday junction resolvase